jgi:hypothetical protein
MMRLVGILIGALLMLAVPAAALADQDAKAKGSAKTLSATGTVASVSDSSLTVKGKADEWTFAVDKDTKITAKGGSTKTAAMKAEGKSTRITDFVKTGDTVRVSYHDMGATKHAADVRVVTSAPAPAKK